MAGSLERLVPTIATMLRRRRRPEPQSRTRTDVVDAFESFQETLRLVEEAKASLAAAAPTGRATGVPLAEALAMFDAGLSAASASMPSWRTAEVESEWAACRAALAEAARRAEDSALDHRPMATSSCTARWQASWSLWTRRSQPPSSGSGASEFASFA